MATHLSYDAISSTKTSKELRSRLCVQRIGQRTADKTMENAIFNAQIRHALFGVHSESQFEMLKVKSFSRRLLSIQFITVNIINVLNIFTSFLQVELCSRVHWVTGELNDLLDSTNRFSTKFKNFIQKTRLQLVDFQISKRRAGRRYHYAGGERCLPYKQKWFRQIVTVPFPPFTEWFVYNRDTLSILHSSTIFNR